MRMREIIDLVESEATALFHGSRAVLKVGDRLVAKRPRLDPEERAVEAVLEHFRPDGCLPRHASIFLVDRPDGDLIERVGGYADHIYQVEPQGPVERNDVRWWAVILNEGALDVAHGSKAERAEALAACRPLAEAYWRGEASDNPAWEYRAAGGRIVRIVEDFK